MTLKTSDGSKDEVVLFDDRMLLQLYSDKYERGLSFFVASIVYVLLFFIVLKSGIVGIFLYIIAGIIIYLGLCSECYIFDFHAKKIYRKYMGIFKLPIVNASQIGYIDKVWAMGLGSDKHFFYRIWIKNKKFGLGVPLSGKHAPEEEFESLFLRYVFPKIIEGFGLSHEHQQYDEMCERDAWEVIKNINMSRLFCHFKVKKNQAYFQHNIKRFFPISLFCLFFALFIIRSITIVFLTKGVILVFLFALFYSEIKYLRKSFFYLKKDTEGVSFIFVPEGEKCYVKEIKHFVIQICRDPVFETFITRIYIYIVLHDQQKYMIEKFSISELRDVDYFIKTIQQLSQQQLLIRIEM